MKLRELVDWYRRQKHRVDGSVIVLLGIAILVWSGVLAASKPAPSRPELTVLLAASAVLQIWGGATFGKTGRVDPEKAKSAVRRLYTLGTTTRDLRIELESSILSNDPDRHRDSVIRADEAIRSLGFHLTDAISDWTDIHAEALQETIARISEQQSRFNTGADGE